MRTAYVQGVDPLWVLWEAFGQPEPTGAHMDRSGRCSRCNATSHRASRVKAVVSDKFTGWEDYTQHADPLWCEACAWGHTDPTLRTRAWRIGGSGACEATPEVLAETLDAPLPIGVALVVPLSRHKHILPAARWGHVTTDDRSLPWESDEVNRFRAVAWLRDQGFNEKALAQPSPRSDQFLTLNPGAMDLVLKRWEALTPWRKDTTYLRIAATGSRARTDAAA